MQAFARDLEDMTGGIVVWVSGTKALVYSDQEHNNTRRVWKKTDIENRKLQSQMDKHTYQ